MDKFEFKLKISEAIDKYHAFPVAALFQIIDNDFDNGSYALDIIMRLAEECGVDFNE